MNRKTLGGATLVISGGFLLRESLVWAFNRGLDALTSGVRGGVSFVSLSWQNGLAAALIIVGMTLVVWPKKISAVAKAERYDHLYHGARSIIRRVRAHRNSRYFNRDHLEPVSDIVRAGDAILLSFAKAGFHVPRLDVQYYEQAAVGQEAYFASLVQLLGRGHIDEARLAAPTASEQAALEAARLNIQHWFISDF